MGLAFSSLASISTNRGASQDKRTLFLLDVNAPVRFGLSREVCKREWLLGRRRGPEARTFGFHLLLNNPMPDPADMFLSNLVFTFGISEARGEEIGKSVENSDGYRLRPARF